VSTNPTSAAYFAKAEPYLKGNHRIALRRELVGELIGTPRGKRILDLGCGDGGVSLPLGDANDLILVDNSQAMLDAAAAQAKRLGVSAFTAIRADAADLDIEPADIVLALGVLAHVERSEDVFAAIARNLKPRGQAVVQFSDASRLVNLLGRPLFALRRRCYRPTPRREVLRIAADHGLALVDERSHLLVLPGVPRLLGSRLLAFDRFVRARPWLASQGADTLLLLEKRDGASGRRNR
jgi:ubiquinone/menaquinone biosynthesis C-methylase UbiE